MTDGHGQLLRFQSPQNTLPARLSCLREIEKTEESAKPGIFKCPVLRFFLLCRVNAGAAAPCGALPA